MDQPYSTDELLRLRKLTRGISEVLRAQMKEYLSTLAPLLKPRVVLGDYIQGRAREANKGADKAFKDLESLYNHLAPAKPFNLALELSPPIEIDNTAIEMTPVEYQHQAASGAESKNVTVTSPLKWTLSYSGFSLPRLRELMANPQRPSDKVKDFLVHYLVLNVVVGRQSGVTGILAALHFPVTTMHLPEFGELPITCISSSISTLRPQDSVIIESTEISGRDAFEEIVNLEDIAGLRSRLKDRIVDVARELGHEIPCA